MGLISFDSLRSFGNRQAVLARHVKGPKKRNDNTSTLSTPTHAEMDLALKDLLVATAA